MITAILLFISNIFMTLAWYGHLKYKDKPLWIAISVSWLLAFFEYVFQVPANRHRIRALHDCAAQGHAGMHHDRPVHDDRLAALWADAALEQRCLVCAHHRGRLLHFQLQQMKVGPNEYMPNEE